MPSSPDGGGTDDPTDAADTADDAHAGRSDAGSLAEDDGDVSDPIDTPDGEVEPPGDAGEPEPPPYDPFAMDAGCTSGLMRDPNESEGEEMMPGHACNSCHADENASSGEGDAPLFGFAGTVYRNGFEPDSCLAPYSEGAKIVVTDADGGVHVAIANKSGNFQFEEPIPLPYHARVEFDGRFRLMVAAQTEGDCNSCHGATGLNSAPGRITLP